MQTTFEPLPIFESLSNPERLRIINLLLNYEPVIIRDVIEALSMSQPMVSRHMQYLKRAGFTTWTKGGYQSVETWYSLKPEFKKEFERILKPYLNYQQFTSDLQSFKKVAGRQSA